MAKMYPEFYPGPPEPEDPEFVFFETLRLLDDSYHIFYSKKFKGIENAKEEVEIDFLIFNGKNCFICLEVKGGEIEYIGAQQAWTQNNANMKKSPDRQAANACHTFIKFMGKDVYDINVDWALGFPQCSSLGKQRIAEIDPELIIDEGHLSNICHKVDTIVKHACKKHGRRGVGQKMATALVDKLSRNLQFIRKMSVRLARNTEQIIKVTKEQFEALEDIELNPRSIVMGYAGTGKSLLAQELAKRKLEENKSVLLMCFNRNLAARLRYAFNRESDIRVTTFHSLSKRLIQEHLPGWWEMNYSATDTFWKDEMPLALFDLDLETIRKYDVIIIDEGQDFKPAWYEFIEECLKDKESGTLAVFLDKHQDIFNHWVDVPWAKHATRKILRKNCRNTKNIVSFIKQYKECDMRAFEGSPIGAEVKLRKVDSQEEEANQLEADLSALLKDSSVSPSQILILINKPKKESVLNIVTKIGKTSIKAMGKRIDPRSKGIHYTNINMFKGLEADIVLITDLHDKEIRENLEEILYTQGTRAKSMLYIYHNSQC